MTFRVTSWPHDWVPAPPTTTVIYRALFALHAVSHVMLDTLSPAPARWHGEVVHVGMCRDEAAVEQMLREVQGHHQCPLQVFVNSAGIVGGPPLASKHAHRAVAAHFSATPGPWLYNVRWTQHCWGCASEDGVCPSELTYIVIVHHRSYIFSSAQAFPPCCRCPGPNR